jgi:hypothetical protein
MDVDEVTRMVAELLSAGTSVRIAELTYNPGTTRGEAVT